MGNAGDAQADFERWAEESGYPLLSEPGELVGQPVGLDPDDPLEWVEKWGCIGNIPLNQLLTPKEIESFRPDPVQEEK